MVGGLFSIDREYFYKVGTYDEGMVVWGGEEIEMSMRLWSCGGSIKMPLCSRVGHMARKRRHYADTFPGGAHNMMVSNMLRFIDVWTDEYKVFFYGINPGAKERRTDVSARLALRKQLKCKSFRWMLEHAYPEAVVYMKRYHLGVVKRSCNGVEVSFLFANMLVCDIFRLKMLVFQAIV